MDIILEFFGRTRQYDNAFALAKKEVANRPTPESYSWLAYSYLKKGNNAKAEEIIEKYVDGKTFESVLLYQAAEVYKANGKLNRVEKLKGELIGALYELGPDMKKQIQNL